MKYCKKESEPYTHPTNPNLDDWIVTWVPISKDEYRVLGAAGATVRADLEPEDIEAAKRDLVEIARKLKD